ncbi:MAG: alpha/beta fold hydrolase [Burkholderia contaminans]|uniref:Alpha/beta hydrolase n=2 Tax=Bacteria TaxID=2 RepID=A0AAP4QXE2_9BURK|nr:MULTISPECIES: alpha/beta hydrolase [Burkholderia]MBD1409552.1 alpha/beta hydrolase [Burkholderia contaminans]MBH9668527.1 alpha/beta hydrolase [Burkholderia contaminans]MBH9675191.1 alpha/beta hydrolase [Burkholderia contaminans]MBH9705614.1 alpha/beta hydrolase [Burkholderia contaminans]MBM6425317.1 alpha/beta hydrolase [Burkholderia contaminans]
MTCELRIAPYRWRICLESNDEDRLREHGRCGADGGRFPRLHADVRNRYASGNAFAQAGGRKDRRLGQGAGEVAARIQNGYATVNGVRLHYVVGGKGEPLVLLPGWPETWWTFHKIMPALAEHYTVIAVDLRGMGASSKPVDGYDKKTMAADIHELTQSLGYDKVAIAGHDIGSAVAFAYAENYPEATDKLVMMEFPHPDNSLQTFPLLPAEGAYGDRLGSARPNLWWFAFNQVRGLPEKLLAGRVRLEQDWLFHYFLVNENAVDARDRAVYEHAYDSAAAIRAGNAWYQAFPQDVSDNKGYGQLQMPVLVMGGPAYRWMKMVVGEKAVNLSAREVENSGHFIQEEQPELVTKAMLGFLEGTRE